jgi:phage I-like protein
MTDPDSQSSPNPAQSNSESTGPADGGTIASVDADGVALAAIQGLAERLDETDDRVASLQAETAETASSDEQADCLDRLEAENERLRERFAALQAGVPAPDQRPDS